MKKLAVLGFMVVSMGVVSFGASANNTVAPVAGKVTCLAHDGGFGHQSRLFYGSGATMESAQSSAMALCTTGNFFARYCRIAKCSNN